MTFEKIKLRKAFMDFFLCQFATVWYFTKCDLIKKFQSTIHSHTFTNYIDIKQRVQCYHQSAEYLTQWRVWVNLISIQFVKDIVLLQNLKFEVTKLKFFVRHIFYLLNPLIAFFHFPAHFLFYTSLLPFIGNF